MIRTAAVLTAAGFVLLASARPASAQDKVQQGSALFSSQKCILCHSIGDKGNKKGPLDDVAGRLKVEEIRAWIATPDAMRVKMKATRTPQMKDMKLAKEQVDALVAFLVAQKGAAANAGR